MKQLLLFTCLVFLGACAEKEGSENVGRVYLAGEIVNPTSDYVVLYKNDIVIDSARLDRNNMFSFTLNEVEEGLHHFDHAPQYQYVYLEKGDSLLIRLNASPAYFDESLVFSGSNEAVNNFLIEMFLTNEDEEPLIHSFFKLQPSVFSKKVDSLRAQKLEELEVLSTTGELSENGYAVAKASIDFNNFLYKEKYPFYHKKKTGNDVFHLLDTGFYDYRATLDLNDKRLSYFRPYYDFIKHYFGNLSYMACSNRCETETFETAASQLHLNKHKMAMIDSLVSEKNLRDNLLRNVAMDYLLKVHKANDDCSKFIQKFEGLSNNQEHVEEIKLLYNGIKGLQPNTEVPHLTLEDHQGNTTTLKELSQDKNAVFYFWTADQRRHFKNVIGHIQDLKRNYPEYHFIGINLKTSRAEWNKMLTENNLDPKEHYWGEDFKKVQNTLIVDRINKCVIAQNALIVDAFGHLYTSFDAMKKP